MEAKRFSKQTSVNNKIIENVKNDDKFIVSVYDQNRCKYTFYESFDMEESDKVYQALIDEQYENMSHQF